MYMLGADMLAFVFWPRRTGFLLASIVPKGISGIHANHPICSFINSHDAGFFG